MSPCHGRVPRRHLNPKNRKKPHNAYVLLDLLPPTIVVGQPVDAKWSIFFPPVPDFDIGSTIVADLTLQPEDTCVYRGSEIPYELGDKLTDTAPLVIPESLFTFPGKNLTRDILLDITGDGIDPGPYEATATLTIEKEIPQPDWWQWNTKSGIMLYADWKSNLDVNGNLANGSKWMHIQKSEINLFESNRSDSPSIETIIRSASAGVIDPGLKKLVSFDRVTQDWDWIDDLTYLIKDDSLEKIFDYHAEFTLTDYYGNVYPNIPSSSVSYTVRVPSTKIDWQIAAVSAYAGFLVMSALAAFAYASIFGSGMGVVYSAQAAALFTTAKDAKAQAEDPPEPDFHYLEVVARRPSKYTNVFINGLGIASFIRIIDRIIGNAEALNQIHGRLLGASLAKDFRGIQIQKKSYLDVLSDWTKSVKLLRQSIPEKTTEESIHFPKLTRLRVDSNIYWQDKGSSIINKNMTPENCVNVMSSLLNNIVISMENVIKKIQYDSSTILAAYDS